MNHATLVTIGVTPAVSSIPPPYPYSRPSAIVTHSSFQPQHTSARPCPLPSLPVSGRGLHRPAPIFSYTDYPGVAGFVPPPTCKNTTGAGTSPYPKMLAAPSPIPLFSVRFRFKTDPHLYFFN